MLNSLRNLRLLLVVLLAAGLRPCCTSAVEKSSACQAALESITATDLGQTLQFLADPKLEGREAGTVGGYAAGDYLVAQLSKLPLRRAGSTNGYFQVFSPNFRNLLARLPGSDPAMSSQVVLIGAHYDHLGHGLNRPPNSPPGPIYPGADDNASGASGVLELARAFSSLPHPPKRTVLIAFWDGEEKGMLGSKYWAAHPTVPLDHVTTVLNVDMIGSLRDSRVTVFGSRSAYGFRRFTCEQNRDAGLLLDFPWLTKANGDHYSFFSKGVPVLFVHTGLHDRYHKPTDDYSHINREGMAQVVRLAFLMAFSLANSPDVPQFRPVSARENDESCKWLTEDDPSPAQPGDPPLRLGIAWRVDEAEPGTVVLCRVEAGSPGAAAGLQVGDRICQIGGRDFNDDNKFAELAKMLPGPLELLVERDGRMRVVVVRFAAQAGARKRAA